MEDSLLNTDLAATTAIADAAARDPAADAAARDRKQRKRAALGRPKKENDPEAPERSISEQLPHQIDSFA